MGHDRRRPQNQKPDIHFDDINIGVGSEHLAHILHLMGALKAQGDQLMAQIDDLKAAQAATKSTLSVIDAKADEILAEVKVVGQGPDLTEVVQSAQENATAADALRAKVQTIDDVLDGVSST